MTATHQKNYFQNEGYMNVKRLKEWRVPKRKVYQNEG